MTKKMFIDELCLRMRAFPPEEAQKTALFYSEAIDDRMEDGMTEEEAVASMGSLDDIIRELEQTLPLTTIVKEKIKTSKERSSNKTVWVLLAVLGFPLWFPLLIAFFGVVFAVCAAIASVIIAVFAVVITVIVVGAILIAGAVILPYPIFAPRIMLGGIGLLCIGVSLLFFPLAKLATRGLKALAKMFVRWVKRLVAG